MPGLLRATLAISFEGQADEPSSKQKQSGSPLTNIEREGRSRRYDLGDCPEHIDGEQMIEVLKQLDDERVLMKGDAGGDDALAAARARVEGEGGSLQPTTPLVKTVDYRTLKGWIG